MRPYLSLGDWVKHLASNLWSLLWPRNALTLDAEQTESSIRLDLSHPNSVAFPLLANTLANKGCLHEVLMIKLLTLLMTVCTAHPPVDDTSVSRQPRLVARTGSEPESGKRLRHAAHLITVHTGKHARLQCTPPVLRASTVDHSACSELLVSALLLCSICVSARIHHH